MGKAERHGVRRGEGVWVRGDGESMGVRFGKSAIVSRRAPQPGDHVGRLEWSDSRRKRGRVARAHGLAPPFSSRNQSRAGARRSQKHAQPPLSPPANIFTL